MQVIREMPLRCLFGLTNFKTYCRVWIEKRKLESRAMHFYQRKYLVNYYHMIFITDIQKYEDKRLLLVFSK